MNKGNEKEVDDLFKKNLEDPVYQVSFREEDWAGLEKMLGKHKKKKGIIYLLPVLSGVAALLLLFLGWWLFRPQVTPDKPQSRLQAAGVKKQVNTGTSGGSKRQPASYTPQQPSAANFAVNSGKNSSGNQSLLKKSAAGARRTAGSSQTATKSIVYYTQDEALLAQSPSPVFQSEQITAATVGFASLPSKSAGAAALRPDNKSISKLRPQTGYRPQFSLTVLAAPDINGVGSFQQGKVGTNIGMQFTVGLSKKFTVTTGGIYSVKPYITNFENYHTPYHFPVNPINVTADCRMLDIPLDIGYQLYNKRQNKISVGTGLSSYIMLHENYKFNYTNSYITGPSDYTVPNSSKYFFGVLNLNATYEHRLNSKVGFKIEPYLKLPLTNIGYSQVRLQTTGVAVGLSWNLNSVTKP